MKVNPEMKILLVDDMAAMRSFSKKILRKVGYKNVSEANDGDVAYEMLVNAYNRHDEFEFIICDWNMPNMLGIELLEKLKADQRFKHIPFLMATAENEQGQVMKAIKAGVDHYIVKPYSPNVLLSKFVSIFSKNKETKK